MTTHAPVEREPAIITRPAATNQPAIVQECDQLIADLDGHAKFTKDTARQIGTLLVKIKRDIHKGNSVRFANWFTLRYRRTSQSETLWMRLANKWDKCQAAYLADTDTEKEPWDRLSIQEVLRLTAKPRQQKETDEKAEAEKKAKMLAEARRLIAEADKGEREAVEPSEGDPFHAGARLDDHAEIIPDMEARALEVLSKAKRLHTVKAGTKIKIGRKNYTVDGPLVFVPSN